MKSRLIGSCAAVLMLCSGCIGLAGIPSSYPGRWPGISALTTKDCSHLTGLYRDFGVYSSLPEARANYLTERLGGSEASSSGASSGPEFSADGVTNDGAVFRHTFRLDPARIECKDGTLFLPAIVASRWDGPAGYRSQRRLALRKAENGDLIGEDDLFTAGHFLVVPIAGSQTSWYRWELLAK